MHYVYMMVIRNIIIIEFDISFVYKLLHGLVDSPDLLT